MAVKEYSAFPKVPALRAINHQPVYCHLLDTRCGGILPLCRDASWWAVFKRSTTGLNSKFYLSLSSFRPK